MGYFSGISVAVGVGSGVGVIVGNSVAVAVTVGSGVSVMVGNSVAVAVGRGVWRSVPHELRRLASITRRNRRAPKVIVELFLDWMYFFIIPPADE